MLGHHVDCVDCGLTLLTLVRPQHFMARFCKKRRFLKVFSNVTKSYWFSSASIFSATELTDSTTPRSDSPFNRGAKD